MDYFKYHNGVLHGEGVNLEALARQYGTPAYVYSRATIERHWKAFDSAFGEHPHLVCYAVKANSNIAVLNIMARLGSGFDIVSIGEMERVLRAGGEPGRIVFSGVGKRADEMRRALEVGIRCFNVESESELHRLNEVAGSMGRRAPVSLRVNPDVDAKTHPYISTGLKENKFGVEINRALALYRLAASMEYIQVQGIDCHIGSQLTQILPFEDALDRVLALIEQLAAEGIVLHHLDIGGGLGIRYRDETPPEPAQYAQALLKHLKGNSELEIIMEPGRAIVGNAGVLLTTVEYLKHTEAHSFAIVDAAMNDLIRPSLYSAWQEIVSVTPHEEGDKRVYDIVGPVCETGDFLGKARELTLNAGDVLAVRSSGAYGFSMSSNYNTRPRAVEVMVDGELIYVVRERETLEQLMAGEKLLP